MLLNSIATDWLAFPDRLISSLRQGQTSLLGRRDVQHPLAAEDLGRHPPRPRHQGLTVAARWQLSGRVCQAATGRATPGI